MELLATDPLLPIRIVAAIVFIAMICGSLPPRCYSI